MNFKGFVNLNVDDDIKKIEKLKKLMSQPREPSIEQTDILI